MSSIDTAIARIQDIALALSTLTDAAGNAITLSNAADYPVENVPPFPACISYLGGGDFQLTNATIHHNFPIINVEFHVSRVNIKQAYMQVNAIAIEFPQRLAGDPTLNGTVTTIVGGAESRIQYTVRPFTWREQTQTQAPILSQMILFTVPIKLLKTPTATT
jgi:hypothetical protein